MQFAASGPAWAWLNAWRIPLHGCSKKIGPKLLDWVLWSWDFTRMVQCNSMCFAVSGPASRQL